MKKKKNSIFIKQWLEFKPYSSHSPTDGYYLKLCNSVYDKLKKNNNFRALNLYLIDGEVQLLSCFLVSYFEDIISNTKVWGTFLKQHEKMYGKKLPFYSIEEYYEGEINEQDIRLLVWYFINSIQDESSIHPYAGILAKISSAVMEIFEVEYEIAPENETLIPFYQLNAKSDYYEVRKFIDTILFSTYLFFPDTYKRLMEAEDELLEGHRASPNLMGLLSDINDTCLHSFHTKLLCLKGKDWAAAILGNEHPLYDHLLAMSPRIQGLFLYKGQDENYINLEHIASGKSFSLLKESFSYTDHLLKVDTIVFLGLVNWKNDWWFSGVFFPRDYDAAIVAEEKKSAQSRNSVAFLDWKNSRVYEILNQQKERFLEYNNGSLIAFLPARQLSSFYKSFLNYYTESLNIPEEEYKKARERMKMQIGEDPIDTIEEDFSEMADDGLIFFNPNSGCELGFGISSAFPSAENPFYNEAESDDAIITLLGSEEFSKELTLYCIDNFKEKLPFFREGIGKKYLDDIDFLLRFWKGKAYHTKPALTLV